VHRRIAWVLVGVVLATLAVAATTIVVISALRAPGQARRDLVGEARALQARLDRPIVGSTARTELTRSGCSVVAILREIDCGVVRPDGTLQLSARNVAETGLPTTVDRARLERGEIVSGRRGSLVWAILQVRPGAARPAAQPEAVIVLSRRTSSPLQPVRGWFVVASGLTVVLGLVAARVLSSRLTRPLAAATAATQAIAAGDLSARLDDRGRPDDELTTLARSINQMGEALQRSRVLEQQFLLSVSHDLRTPLTSIRGYAEALADGTLTDVGKGAAVIEREAGRLERLVRDLLDLSRLDARAFRLELQPVDLGTVAAAAVEALRPDAEANGLALQSWPGTPATVVGDRDRLAQVVANLVENALKYAVSRADVRVTADATHAWLVVADDGPGIPAEDLPHVFERLYVSKHAPVRREVGSGLGLAIVHELVTAMGGEVQARANQPRGTQMVVRFPLAGGPGPRPGGVGPPAAAHTSGSASTVAAASPPSQRTVA
jgi:two-component system sensor histidine kinase BaeS